MSNGSTFSRFDVLRCDRRQALQAMAAGIAGTVVGHTCGVAEAADVDWLADVQKAPETIPRENLGVFEPLLVGSDGKPIRTVADWNVKRRELRGAWLKFLGPMPVKRPPVKLQILKTERPAKCIRQLVRYEGEPGLFVEGYLLRPDSAAASKRRSNKLPGIVALHQTTRQTIDEIAGVTGPEMQHLGLKLCQRGFVVFCPRNFLWQSVANYQQAVIDFQKRHPKTLGMHKMLYDAIRGVDVLASLDDVDTNRIGTVGHSLGAKEALYLAAFDDRIKAAVASEGGTSFRSTNWNAPWYLGKGIEQPGFKRNHHELLALIAPRPFLILAGESGSGAADGDRTWPFIEAALPVYRLHGKPARVGIYNHCQGHSIPPKAFDRLANWLETYLAK